MRPNHLLTIIGAFVVALLVAASAIAQSQKPVPQLTGRVVDLAGMVTAEWEQKLTAQLLAHEEKTGNQIAVLTIPSLNGEALEDYSLRVARTWALGQKEKNNGVLLLVAKADRKMRIEVGYGVESTLTDAISSFIINATMKPLFRKGLFNGGIVAGAGQIIEVLESDKAALDEWKNRAKPRKGKKQTRWPMMLIFALWAMIIGGSAVTSFLVKKYGREIKPGHYRWLGMDAGPNAPKPKRSSSGYGGGGGGGWSSGGGGFSGGGGSFGGGGSSGGW